MLMYTRVVGRSGRASLGGHDRADVPDRVDGDPEDRRIGGRPVGGVGVGARTAAQLVTMTATCEEQEGQDEAGDSGAS